MQMQRAAMAGSVFLVALATGYVMQNGDAVASRFASVKPAGDQIDTPIAKSLAPTAAVVQVEAVAPLPEEPKVVSLARPATETFADRKPLPDVGTDDDMLAADDALSPFGLSCEIGLVAEPGPAATVRLSVTAPCHAGQSLTVSQESLRFTEITDPNGMLERIVPALSTNPVFDVTFEDGTEVRASTVVPDASEFKRVALQWKGETGLQLHAYEFGADFGEAGHVHAGAIRAPERAMQMGVGYFSKLGQSGVPGGWTGEVYSFPATSSQDRGVVRISIEAEVTMANCGREISAETLQRVLGSELDVVDVTLSMPACDAVGDFLVLNNVLRDMKIAAN